MKIRILSIGIKVSFNLFFRLRVKVPHRVYGPSSPGFADSVDLRSDSTDRAVRSRTHTALYFKVIKAIEVQIVASF